MKFGVPCDTNLLVIVVVKDFGNNITEHILEILLGGNCFICILASFRYFLLGMKAMYFIGGEESLCRKNEIQVVSDGIRIKVFVSEIYQI